VPYGILVSDKPVNDNDEKKIKASWYSSFSGAFRAFRMAVLGKGLVYQQIASSHSDIAFKDLLGMSEATIKGVYQIPPVMSGDYAESRYNTTEQRKIFYTQVIIPAMGKYVEALNNYLVPLYYPNSDYEFYADYSDKEFYMPTRRKPRRRSPPTTAQAFRRTTL
jgi:Phage-related protein